MKKLVYVGSPHELQYNKTKAMHQTFQLMPVAYEFVSIEATARNRFTRARQLVAAYWRLGTKLKDAQKGDVLWLSEFKFSPWHSFLAKCVTKTRGMKLISGPHTVTEDRTLLIDPSFQTNKLSLRQQATLFRQRLINGLTIVWLDGLQTYTPEYLARIQKLPFAKRKPSVIFPIAIPTDTYRAACEHSVLENPTKAVGDKIKIAFWGVPTVLHGVDTLVHAVHLLRQRNVPVEAYIFAPRNTFVESAQAIAKELQIEDSVFFDHTTRINENFGVIAGMDIAVSHLVAMKSSDRMRAIIDTYGATNKYAGTNKLLEIWALSLPALIANSSADSTLSGNGCIFVESGNPSSVAQAVIDWTTKRDTVHFSNRNNISDRAYSFTPPNLYQYIYNQLNPPASATSSR